MIPSSEKPIPNTAMTIAARLSIPPLTRGDADMKKPIIPNTIANSSTTKPHPGWPAKISKIPPMAAVMASVAAIPVLCSMAFLLVSYS